jgi:protoheme IX farnesyltransferase
VEVVRIMAEALALSAAPVSFTRNVVDLGKPRITMMVVFTTAVGLWLAGAPLPIGTTAAFLAATALLVFSANTLNCWLERDIDARMVRTRDRPLPSGRLTPATALVAGSLQGVVALAMLGWTTNALTVILGGTALATYVLVYTPLKRISPLALHVGAVPGAIPPLMGWTAATGELGTPGWTVFAILFAWQLPHFLAISLYLREDYERGGLRVVPVALGVDTARRHLLVYAWLLGAVALTPFAFGVAGPWYGGVAAILSIGFIEVSRRGVRARAGAAWARRVMLASVAYLPVLITVLLLDAR